MTRFEKWAIWLTSLATVITGIAYGFFKYLVTPADPFAVVGHPLEPWALRLHVLASPLLVFAIGAVSLKHAWWHFRSRIRTARRSGLLVSAVAGPMILSGYLIQVLTSVGWLTAMVIVHLTTGILFTAGLVLHQLVLGRRRGSMPRESSSDSASSSGRRTPAADPTPVAGTASPGSARGPGPPSRRARPSDGRSLRV